MSNRKPNSKHALGQLAFALLFVATRTLAMDGVFDRTAEVAKYLESIETGSRGAVITVAKEIYVSGISDEKLGTAIERRLLADYKELSAPKYAGGLPGYAIENVDEQYGGWMVRALASMGDERYRATLQKVRDHADLGRVRQLSADEMKRLSWHRSKNDIMASRAHHSENDDPRASQLLNLLLSDDEDCRKLAVDRIRWEKQTDPRIFAAIANQVTQYLQNPKNSRDDRSTMAFYIRLLGESGNRNYQPVVAKVLSSKADVSLKRQAQTAFDKLK